MANDLHSDYYGSEPAQAMSHKPGFETVPSGLPSDLRDPLMEHTNYDYEDDDSQHDFQQQQQQEFELQQHQQYQSYHDPEDELGSHNEFTGSGMIHDSGDYYGNRDAEDLPANFARGNQEVPQAEDEPRSLEDQFGGVQQSLGYNPGEFPHEEDETNMAHGDQQVVPASNIYDDERPIMGSYNKPYEPKDDSPQEQEMPQDFGAAPLQQQQQNSDDEEDDTIDEVHPAEAGHNYDRLEEEPHINDVAGDIDAEDADIEMDPIDNVQFEERQDIQEMEFPADPSRAACNSSHPLDRDESDLVSGGFHPSTFEEPIQASTAAPGVESCAEIVPEDDFGPNDVEERMMSHVVGGVESGVPIQMMLDDQEDDEDKENAAPQKEVLLHSQRTEHVESGASVISGQEVQEDPLRDEESIEEAEKVKGEYEDEEDVSEASLKDDVDPARAVDMAGLDNPAFAEDETRNVLDNRKLDQISEFEDVEKEKAQDTQDDPVMGEWTKQEEAEFEQTNDEDRSVEDSELGPQSEQFSSQEVTSELESTPKSLGFVDNLSELASPAEVIPQPLPSPPEPREGISPYDALDDRDSPYEKYKENESDAYTDEYTREEPTTDGAAEREESGFDESAGVLPAAPVGQGEAGFPSCAGAGEMSGFEQGDTGAGSTSLLQDSSTAGGAADFLTGEIEGETTFGVDGTAATTLTETTAPTAEIINTRGQENAGFLNSEDEEDEDEEEEEDVSQLMDQGIGEAGDATNTTTTTTTTTEEASDELTGTGMEQEAATDNALMSMSMEGSFYDDGGDVIGADDQGRQHGGGAGMNHLSNSMYHPDPITEESASQPSSYDQRMDGFLSSQTDDQNFSQDLMQRSTDVADNILGEKEMEQQQSGVAVTTAQEYSSTEAAAFDGVSDVTQQQEKDEEESLRQMEEQLRLEEEQLRQEEELQRQEEEKRRQEEDQRKLEEEQRLEEERLRQEEELRRQEEEERLRLEEDERLRQEEEKLRQEEEKLRQEEEEKMRQEQERLRQEEEDRLRQEEEDRLRQEEEERLRQEEERLRQEEEQRMLEEERLKQEEIERKKQEEEEEERRLEAERQQQQQEEEERRRLEEEQRLQEEEERQRAEEEQKRLQEEEQKRLQEEEQKRLQEEEQERARQEELAKASASEDLVAPVTEAPAEAPVQPDDSSSVDAPAKVEDQPAAAAAPSAVAAAAPAAAVATTAAVVAAAAAASPEKKTTAKSAAKTSASATSATKKSATPASKAASAKTTTSATKSPTKTPTKPTTNGRPASATAKKTDTPKTPASSAAQASKKPFDNRPITALERKAAAAKPTPTTSATRPTSASKSNAPLPSYAQPITPRKPREAKVLSPEEKKKATTGRTPSATARASKPQTATTSSTTRATSATSTSTTRASSATTRSATSSGSTSPTKTSTAARPKSSPTKLSNGTASDTKTFTVSTKPANLGPCVCSHLEIIISYPERFSTSELLMHDLRCSTQAHNISLSTIAGHTPTATTQTEQHCLYAQTPLTTGQRYGFPAVRRTRGLYNHVTLHYQNCFCGR
ncbi:hypothetical protein RRG08_008376 [Elysia crispata]|uniref:Uncharacterized protein n=1 Tax=Elysia crispata TaxID=231223 RepID=A0AAE1E7B4_9GAST|nr:hypothetical protein RRG08_008376 [Elysia crispata]